MPERYQREIEEILLKTASNPSRRRRVSLSKWLWNHFASTLRHMLVRLSQLLSPERLMLLSLGMFLGTLIARALVPGMTTYFAMAGLLLFIGSYVSHFKRSPSSEKRWRSQILQHPRARWAWLRRLFRR